MSRFTEMVQKIWKMIADRPNVQAMGLLAFWTIASRALGAVKILVIGQLSTQEADIFNAAFVLPDNIIAVFIVGSITLATLPHIIELHEREGSKAEDTTGSEAARTKEAIYITHVTLWLSGLIGLMTIVALIFTGPLLQALNPDLRSNLLEIQKWDEYLTLTRILLLAPLIFCIKTIFGSFLNARRKFAVYATDGVITNLGILIGLLALYNWFGLAGAVWGVILGFAVSAIAFGVDAYRHGLRFNLGTFPELNQYLKQTLILYLPRLLIIPSLRVAETMVTLTASEANGEITVLKTALDLQSIPLGVVAVAAVVFLPDITTLFVTKGFGRDLKQLLRKYLIWGSGFSFLGFIGATLGAPIIFWVLDFLGLISPGSFFDSADNIQLIVICTAITSASLVFQTAVEFYNRVYTAMKNITIPLLSSVVGNAIGIGLTYLFASQFGAAIATSIGFSVSAVLQALIAVYFLNKIGAKFKPTGSTPGSINSTKSA